MHRRVIFLFAFLLFCKTALAAELNYPIITQHHTAWSAKDGVPGRITGLAQTPDGWLWMASSRGLFRFDGVSFEKYQDIKQPLASSSVLTVGTLPSGALWAGYRFGGFSVLQDGKLSHFGAKDGLPPSTVRTVVHDLDGGVWVGTASGLYHRAPGAPAWRLAQIDGVSAKARVGAILLDDAGTLWVRTVDATVARARGESAFRRAADGGSYGQIVKAPDGSIWMSDLDKAGLQMLHAPTGRPVFQPPALPAISYLAFDQQGNAWAAPSKEFGVLRVGRAQAPDRVTWLDEPQGLSGTVNAMLVDREGNTWIGTGKGLDRFRANRLESIDVPDYLADARPIAAGPNGSLRVDRYVLERPGQGREAATLIGPPPTAKNIVTNVYSDPDGSFWIGSLTELFHVVDGRSQTIDLPPTEKKEAAISGMAKDATGALWIIRSRLQRYRNGVWQSGGGHRQLEDFKAIAIFCDSRGRMWFGSTTNEIALLDGEQLRILQESDGPRLGSIKQFTEYRGEIWIGGEDGVAVYDGKRFATISARAGDAFSGASGLVFDAKGTLWINGLYGISGITAAELAAARRDSAYKVRFSRYDFLDGLRGTPAQYAQTPTALMGTDGRMWFSTSFGIYNLAPEAMARNPLRPTVLVRRLRSGEMVFDATGTPALPPGSTSAQIDYTALSLTMPERMQFKYRLEGVDEAWQEAGTRRTAYYTGLAPGHYRFRVIASNNDGLWNESGASLDFSIQPSFVQTIWFKSLCAAAFLLALYLFYRWRLALATRRAREHYHVRLLERERIARALHDTLLQGVQILTTRFQLAMAPLPSGLPERRMMEKALDAADQVIAEARDQVSDLRLGPETGDRLQSALRQLAGWRAEQQVECVVGVTGAPRDVPAQVCDEMAAIAREAFNNALQHAQAGRVDITLAYRDDGLRLGVKDDGRGMAPAILQAGGRSGHWGLPGMRERAAALKAELEIRSAPDAGTEIALIVPAHLAYRAADRAARWGWLRRR
ncbi:sensor histidine kinase [Pseudoduganella violacea]|uniref:Signal transduction histidine kinase/ligand-binding sensor domain-containing protein n=1 Tax=Pseudoduganella violacea TaxID=1715466 RepID=A0A7W5BEC2_9BURK|nr:sensor histidine kinase [Pseudoduganella violacea]MBB3120645.1 signal transduction histidine kinase/ligand-binding sensor domain-containing protein [Pseudoduganella violacea]